MTEETLPQEEEVEETTPQPESESSDASEDLESLFADEPKETQEEDPQAKIKSLEEKLSRIEKGVSKFFSEKGRETKSQPREAKVETGSSVIKNLYFNANPEAKEIWSEVEKTAKQVGKDPFDLYESSSYFKGEAKARAEAKRVDEENKAKISKPSSDVAFAKNIESVKEEDLHKLKPAEKVKWIEAQARKERANTD